MKIEIEIPDLEEIYYSDYDGDELTGKDLKKIIADIAIEKFIYELYNSYMNDSAYDGIRKDVKEIIKTHSKEIIDRVVDKVSDEMPKKSEIANINKEWQDYFVELIDKAIAKRFK